MILIPLLMLALGLLLSAFFSGSETGFYRASRVRVVMAGLDGDRVSQLLLKLLNNPAWMIATALIGNNLANYLVSLSIVLLAGLLPHRELAEMFLPLLFTPILFVYGELLPKNLFFNAPNYLIRLVAPWLLIFSVVFAPITVVLWGFGKLLERLLRQSPQKIRSQLARRELQQFLEEGLEAGVLLPTQSQLAQNFFLTAAKPVLEFFTPLSQAVSINSNTSVEQALKKARQFGVGEMLVVQGKLNQIVGYIRTVDLHLEKKLSKPIRNIRKLTEIQASELYGEAIIQMQTGAETMMKVVNSQQQVIGIVTMDSLTNPMLKGQLDSLKR